ncbi:MAG TPA: hypothetical protein VIU34_05785 [Steroidobacter sp.]
MRVIGSRWNTPRRRYAGGWQQNPWINAVYSTTHAGSNALQRNDSHQDGQQTAAVRTWENEGGSLGTHPGMG